MHDSPANAARALCAVMACAVLAACAPAPEPEQTHPRWRLPDQLREISGLALTADQRLLAVDDEVAVIYELDFEAGRIVKSFSAGAPPLRADFEGIAVLDDTVWLMTSDGVLYALAEGAGGERVDFERVATGLGDYCEFEGLAADAAAGNLLLACKETHDEDDPLLVYEIPAGEPDSGPIAQHPLPERAIAEAIGKRRVNPSGLTLDPASGDWLLVAARQRAFIRLEPGRALRSAILFEDRDWHRQAEGIEMTRDGRLLIADEGGSGKGRLAIYDAQSMPDRAAD